MIGTTALKALRVDCIVGVYEAERLESQPVDLDIELDYDFAAAHYRSSSPSWSSAFVPAHVLKGYIYRRLRQNDQVGARSGLEGADLTTEAQ